MYGLFYENYAYLIADFQKFDAMEVLRIKSPSELFWSSRFFGNFYCAKDCDKIQGWINPKPIEDMRIAIIQNAPPLPELTPPFFAVPSHL